MMLLMVAGHLGHDRTGNPCRVPETPHTLFSFINLLYIVPLFALSAPPSPSSLLVPIIITRLVVSPNIQLLLYAYGTVPPLQRDLLLPSTGLGEYIYRLPV